MQLDATRCSRICMELSDSNPPDGLDGCLVVWWIAVLPMAAIIRKPLSPWHSSLLPLKQRPCEKSTQIGCQGILRKCFPLSERIGNSRYSCHKHKCEVPLDNCILSCLLFILAISARSSRLQWACDVSGFWSSAKPKTSTALLTIWCCFALSTASALNVCSLALLSAMTCSTGAAQNPTTPNHTHNPMYIITHFPVILNCLCVILYITPLHVWSGTCLRLYILIQIHDCYIVIWE